MTPDEIQKDREAGTLIDKLEAILNYRGGFREERQAILDAIRKIEALTAENAALKERVAELETALHPFSKTAGEMFSRNWEKDDVALKFVKKGKAFIVTFSDFLNAHAALGKSYE